MIVECESCHTKFRLDPARLKSARNKVRCSECGNVFSVSRGEDAPGKEAEASEFMPFEDEQEDSSPPSFSYSPQAKPTKRLITRPLIALCCLLVLTAVGIYLMLSRSGPTKSPNALNTEGNSLPTAQSALKILPHTQPYFVENTHVGQLFVVEGEVVNESPRPVSFVMIEGKLYNTNFVPVVTQRCFLGNVMTRDELMRKNINEIQGRMMNREGKNLANVNIPTGKRVPYMLVFHNLPDLKALSDYSAEIVSAQFD